MKWTEHRRGVFIRSFVLEADDGSTLAIVVTVRGSLWTVELTARQDRDERPIDYRGTDEEVRAFAEHLLGWYRRQT